MWGDIEKELIFGSGFGEEKNMEKAYMSYNHGHPIANCTRKQQDAQVSFACIQIRCIVADLASITRYTRSNEVIDVKLGVTCLGELNLDVSECTGLMVRKR